MLYLKANSTEKLTVTGRELLSSIYHYLTFEIINKDTRVKTIFSATNSSTSPYYDQYYVGVYQDGENLSKGVLNVRPGQYHYNIYEMATQSNDLSLSLGIVENGILEILGTYSNGTVFVNPNDTVKIFNYTLPAPELEILSIDNISVLLGWDSVYSATNYRVDMSLDNFSTYVYNNVSVGNGTTASLMFTQSGTYSIRMRSKNVAYTSVNSNVVTQYLDLVVTPPEIEFVSSTPDSILIQWEPVIGATSYAIDVSDQNFAPATFEYENYDMGNVTSFNITGLGSSTEWYIRVRTVIGIVQSDNSNVLYENI